MVSRAGIPLFRCLYAGGPSQLERFVPVGRLNRLAVPHAKRCEGRAPARLIGREPVIEAE